MIEFKNLFAGLKKAYGTYLLDNAEVPAGKKQKGKAQTVNEPVTEELYFSHLAGEMNLGIVPINEKGMVLFAAIDIDDYHLDIKHLAKVLKDLPFIVCRSKSGGAHVYIFFTDEVPAKKVIAKLEKLSASLGYSGSEIFPKQVSSNPDTIGNWINLPYFDAEQTTRYAIDHEGNALTFDEFLALAEQKRVGEEEFLKLEIEKNEFADAPPCLEALCKNGFPEGSMNNGLFNMGIYAKMKFKDWESKVSELNTKYMAPGSPKEVKNVIGSLAKKDYIYMCNQAPINQYCNKRVCRGRKYGIKGHDSGYDLGFEVKNVEIVEAGTCIWNIELERKGETKTISITSADIRNQDRFIEACLDGILWFPEKLKQTDWRDFVNEMVAMAIRVKAPRDAHPDSQFYTYLEKFCLERGDGKDKDSLLNGAPWHDAGRTYFRSFDLYQFLTNNGVKMPKNRMYGLIKTQFPDIEHKQLNIKGRNFNVWSIPSFPEQTEDLDVPSLVDNDVGF